MISHQDNAQVNRAGVKGMIVKRTFEILEHSAYSPDLGPCDFLLFPALKQVIRGKHFDDIQELPSAVQSAIFSISHEIHEVPVCLDFPSRESRTSA